VEFEDVVMGTWCDMVFEGTFLSLRSNREKEVGEERRRRRREKGMESYRKKASFKTRGLDGGFG